MRRSRSGGRPAQIRTALALTKAGILEALASPRELWRAVLWESLDAVDADRGALLLLDDDRRLRLRAVCDLDRDLLGRHHELLERARRTGRPTIVGDEALRPPATDGRPGSAVALPIRGSLETRGVLYLERLEPAPFAPATLEALEQQLNTLIETLEAWEHSASARGTAERAPRLLRLLRDLVRTTTRPTPSIRELLDRCARVLGFSFQAGGARLTLRAPGGEATGLWARSNSTRAVWNVCPLPPGEEPSWLDSTDSRHAPRFGDLLRAARARGVALGSAVRWRGEVGDEPSDSPITAALELHWPERRRLTPEETAFLEDSGSTWLTTLVPSLLAVREASLADRYGALLAAPGLLVIRHHVLTGACETNDALTKLTGYRAEELTREGWTRLLFAPGARRSAVESRCAALRAPDREWLTPLATRSGELVAVRWQALPVGENGREILVIGRRVDESAAVEDSTARAESERDGDPPALPATDGVEALSRVLEEVLDRLEPWLERPEVAIDPGWIASAASGRLRASLRDALSETIGRQGAQPMRLRTERVRGSRRVLLHLEGARHLWEGPGCELEGGIGRSSTGSGAYRVEIDGSLARFTWKLPSRNEPAPPLRRPKIEGPVGDWCLVIEPDELVREILVDLISLEIDLVRAVADGRSAWRLMEEKGLPERIFLDADLFDIDPAELIAALRCGAEHPRVALCSGDPELGREVSALLGADAFLAKPFDASTVAGVLARLRVGQR